MSLVAGFDATTYVPDSKYTLIPVGTKATALIVEADDKVTGGGTGAMLSLTFEIVEGEFKGRKVWHNLNLQNQSETAVAIAQRDLHAICLAINTPRLTANGDLMNKPLKITIGQELRKDTQEMKNNVKKFESVTASNGSAAPKTANGTAAKPAWARG